MKLFSNIFAALSLWLTIPAGAQIKVATLHPILTDLATQVGGTLTKVAGLVPPGADVHHFSPTPKDVKKLAGSQLILASGKNMEHYLGNLRSNLVAGQELIEVGRTIPSLKIDAKDAMFMCCPEHAHGAIDPHWWNSIENMQRASRIVAEAFSEKDPANKKVYKANSAAYSQRLDVLKKWARQAISALPAERRKLATSHLSLSYFAREFGFKLVPVQGLSHEVSATSKEMAAAIQTIQQHKIAAIFPEKGVNPKYLKELAKETGVRIGGELVSDGNGTGNLVTFEAAFRSNVEQICKALAP